MPPYAALDKGRPIGWDGRSVHGCSVFVPTKSWTESVEIPIGQFTFDYEATVEVIQNSPLNLAPFRDCAALECRFAGMQAQVSTQNPDFVIATFDFEKSPNYGAGLSQPAITIDGIANITKFGWDYLDVHYEPQIPAGQNAVVPMAQYVLTHTMYYASDFSLLNIGTGLMLPTWQG